jgi:type VI protein secretion system component VasK
LGHSMEEIARSSNNPDPSIHQAASQNYDKALAAVHQIAQGFRPVGVEGIDGAVQRLLEEPVRLTKPFIITDIGKAAGGKINAELHAFCGHLRSTIRKYPFQQSTEDLSLEELATAFAPATGTVWKFQAEVLGELTVKDGSQWKAKDPAKKPQLTPGMLAFLNHAQSITDAFYPAGVPQTQLTYTLRPKLDSSFKDATLELDMDGHVFQWTTPLQKQFTWPAPPGTQDLGAVAKVRAGVLTIPVASRGGLWGIFRIMGDAEPRPLNSRMVEWKNLRGGDGRLEPIQPAPVRIEIVEFPGGRDMFNPEFFEGLQCPANAVQ